MAKIASRSSGPGRSTKKISSNRPLRINSGGNCARLFAVAIRKIGWRWSCIQDSSVPNIRCDRPPSAESLLAEANAFSISSIHKHDRGHRLGLLQGLAEPRLALADELLVEHAGVHPHQRHPPGRGDHLRAQALAAALHAQQQDAARRIEAELAGTGREAAVPQVEPALQVVQPADLVRRNVGGDRLQAAGRPQQVALGLDDPRQVGAVQHVVVADGAGDHAGGLFAGQPAQRLHEHLQLALGELGFDLLKAAALHVLKGLADDLHQVPLRPASPRRRERSAGAPPAASRRRRPGPRSTAASRARNTDRESTAPPAGPCSAGRDP